MGWWGSERLKLLLTGLLVLHLLIVVDNLGPGWIPGGQTWLKTVRAGQSWDMFSRPRPKGWALEVYGVRDGERALLWPSAAREPSRLLYSRTTKVQQNLSQKKGASKRQHLARLLCDQDPSLQAVELTNFALNRPRKEAYRKHPDAVIEWNEIGTYRFECSL